MIHRIPSAITVNLERRSEPTHHEAVLGAMLICGICALILTPSLPYISATPCIFKVITGFPCLTCGTARAFHCIGILDFQRAFRLNPAVTLSITAGLVYFYYSAAVVFAGARVLKIKVSKGWMKKAPIAILLFANWVFLVVDGR